MFVARNCLKFLLPFLVIPITLSAQSVVKGNQVTLKGATSGQLNLKPSAATTSHTLTFPAAQGGSSTYLSNDGSGGLSWASIGASTTSNLKNYAQNADFRFWQRQTPGTLTSRQDDAYAADRWYVLTSGGAVNVQSARVAEVITASPSQYVAQIRQADASARQIAYAQILEYARVIELRSMSVTFAFYARTDTTEITTLRACIGEWTGTADSVTSDVVSSWAATPTWIANFACVNTPSDITISSSWAQTTINATLGSSFNNLVLLVWTSGTEAQNDDFYLAQPQLVQGSSAIAWDKISKHPEEDLREVQRFYEKSYLLDTAPASNSSSGASNEINNNTASTYNMYIAIPFKVRKRTSPTMVYYNMVSGTTGQCEASSGTDLTATNNISSDWNFNMYCNSVPVNQIAYVQWTADAEL